MLFNVVYHLSYYRRVKRLVRLLEDGRTKEYIAGIQALLATAKGKNLRNLLTLNLAAGYIEAKQFDTAIPMLEELSSKKLKGSAVQLVHHIDLCMGYFQTGQREKALALYNDSRALLEKYRGNPAYGGSIATLDVMAAIMNLQFHQAKKLLDAAAETYPEARFQKVFGELAQICAGAFEQPGEQVG